MGFRDAGSVPVYLGEKSPTEGLVPDGCLLRLPRGPRPGSRDRELSADALFAKKWQVLLGPGLVIVAGIAVLFFIPVPAGATRAQGFMVMSLLLFIGAGGYQFARDRASLAIILAVVPIGISVLPPFTQMVAEARIDAFLYQFGLSSSYMSYTPGETLMAVLRPVLISAAAFGIAVAFYGWLRFFAHTQHWFEWIFLFLALVTYTLTAVSTAGQVGQHEGAQAVFAARSSGSVPSVYGYSPTVACIEPVGTSAAFEGASLPTSLPTLVFGSSNGQTAVWDPRTGQTTLVSTDAVRIVSVDSLRQPCPR